MEINGSRCTPLVVHAAVVFGPLAALAALAYAVLPALARPAALADGRRSALIAAGAIWTAYLTGEDFLDSERRSSRQLAEQVETHEDRGRDRCCWVDVRVRASVAARRRPGWHDRAPAPVRGACSSVPGRGRAPSPTLGAASVLTGDAGAQAVWGYGVEPGSVVRLAASGEQPPERRRPARGRPSPAATASSSPHSGSSLAVGAAARAVLGHLVEVGERLDQVLRLDVGEPERPDARGVDDPAARRRAGQRAA